MPCSNAASMQVIPRACMLKPSKTWKSRCVKGRLRVLTMLEPLCVSTTTSSMRAFMGLASIATPSSQAQNRAATSSMPTTRAAGGFYKNFANLLEQQHVTTVFAFDEDRFGLKTQISLAGCPRGITCPGSWMIVMNGSGCMSQWNQQPFVYSVCFFHQCKQERWACFYTRCVSSSLMNESESSGTMLPVIGSIR